MSALSFELLWKLYIYKKITSGAVTLFQRCLRGARLCSGIIEVESNWSGNKKITYISTIAMKL